MNVGGFLKSWTLKWNPRTPNVHIYFRSRRFKHHQNFTRRHPERHKKSEMVAGEGKKSAKFWASHPSLPHPSGPHPLGHHHDGQNWFWPKPRWPKMDWPKLDWPKLVKSGWPKRDWPKSVLSARHRFRRHYPQASGPHSCPAVKPRGREGHSTVSIRLDHHVIHAMTDMDPSAKVLFVDGTGDFDLISRAAMLEGSHSLEEGRATLPFVRQFFDCSVFLIVGGRWRRETHSDAGRGERAGRYLCSFHWVNMELCSLWHLPCCQENACLRSWTTCMWCARPRECPSCTAVCEQLCGNFAHIRIHVGIKQGRRLQGTSIYVTVEARLADPHRCCDGRDVKMFLRVSRGIRILGRWATQRRPQKRHTGGNAQLQAPPRNASSVAWCGQGCHQETEFCCDLKAVLFLQSVHQFPCILPLEILVTGISGPPFASPLATPSSDLLLLPVWPST